LEWDHRQERENRFERGRHPHHIFGDLANLGVASLAMARIGPLRARNSCRLLVVFSQIESDGRITTLVCAHRSAQPAMFHLGRWIPFRMDVRVSFNEAPSSATGNLLSSEEEKFCA
jgi:hypothetical protein